MPKANIGSMPYHTYFELFPRDPIHGVTLTFAARTPGNGINSTNCFVTQFLAGPQGTGIMGKLSEKIKSNTEDKTEPKIKTEDKNASVMRAAMRKVHASLTRSCRVGSKARMVGMTTANSWSYRSRVQCGRVFRIRMLISLSKLSLK